MDSIVTMDTTVTIKKDLKAKLDTIGLKSESYNDIIEKLYNKFLQTEREAVQKHAKKLLILHDSKSTADTYHRKILEDVASGNSRSWNEVKKEL
jgi:hypothetical protein